MALRQPWLHLRWARRLQLQSKGGALSQLLGQPRCLAGPAAQPRSDEGLQASPVLDLTTKSVVRISRKLTVGQVAGALLQTQPFLQSSKGRLILEAENDASLSVALNALALCNRRLSKAAAKQRIAFVPVVRVFRYQEPGKAAVHLRRAMQLLLHAWDAAKVVVVRRKIAQEAPDVVSVRGDTDLRRLSGLVQSRFQQSCVGIEELVVVRSMGSQAIDKMVKALAAAWQRCARTHEGHLREAGFHCYIEHQRTPSVGCQKLVYSGVECTLLPGSERADVAEESKTLQPIRRWQHRVLACVCSGAMAAVATVDEDKEKERVMSLPQLQNLMKRDPEAYSVEFDQQWSHFDSQMEIFKLKPQKPSSSFAEQVMFLAHVAPSFPDRAKAFPDLLISALNDHFEVMHSNMRTTLVQALILLRNRNQFPCSKTLPVYFKLFKSQDKGLRKSIFTHIVRDIAHMNQKSKNQKVNFELRDFFFARLKESETEVCRHACAVFITMYRQNVWCDTHVANLMSAGLLHPDLKIAAALAHLFLGNKTKGLEGILDESDDEEEDDNINEAVMGIVGAKKTGNRVKRLKRAKKAAKKAARKNGKKDNSAVSFVAIDLLNDPQTLAEKLLQRLSKGGEPFLFRLLMLHLVARLIGRHQLQVLNLYPFLQKYLVPTQKEVTKVMAALVEASHPAVPPDDVRPVILHIVRYFVTEANSPEIIEVGLNTIREVCARSINILTEDELADLCSFRKHKNKGHSATLADGGSRSAASSSARLDPFFWPGVSMAAACPALLR
ncbi:SDAD1 [Symbiodinium sp. CCMP2592]|nr:SDAD1 [Symbiodinium sp. CCMP2592]